MIDEALLRIKFLNVADGCFANGPDLKLFAIGERVRPRAETSLPVPRILSKFHSP